MKHLIYIFSALISLSVFAQNLDYLGYSTGEDLDRLDISNGTPGEARPGKIAVLNDDKEFTGLGRISVNGGYIGNFEIDDTSWIKIVPEESYIQETLEWIDQFVVLEKNIFVSDDILVTITDTNITFSRNFYDDSSETKYVPVGGIIIWTNSVLPAGAGQSWAICDGQNGTPDLRGRFIVGKDPTISKFNSIGKRGGSEGVDIQQENMPRHTHTVQIEDANISIISFAMAEHTHQMDDLLLYHGHTVHGVPNFNNNNKISFTQPSLTILGQSFTWGQVVLKFKNSTGYDIRLGKVPFDVAAGGGVAYLETVGSKHAHDNISFEGGHSHTISLESAIDSFVLSDIDDWWDNQRNQTFSYYFPSVADKFDNHYPQRQLPSDFTIDKNSFGGTVGNNGLSWTNTVKTDFPIVPKYYTLVYIMRIQ